MTIRDIGPDPQSFDLETETLANTNYRTVAWSGKYLQLTLMSIPVGGDIGLEAHPDTDQFLRLDGGRGRVQMGPAKDQLDFDREVEDGWAILVPAGTWHNVTNIGDEPMQLLRGLCPGAPRGRQDPADRRGRGGRRGGRRGRAARLVGAAGGARGGQARLTTVEHGRVRDARRSSG